MIDNNNNKHSQGRESRGAQGCEPLPRSTRPMCAVARHMGNGDPTSQQHPDFGIARVPRRRICCNLRLGGSRRRFRFARAPRASPKAGHCRRFAASPLRRFAAPPFRRSAAPPLRRSAAPPLRRSAAPPLRRFAGHWRHSSLSIPPFPGRDRFGLPRAWRL